MAASAKNISTKGRKQKRGIFCFALGCCGGSSTRVQSSGEAKLAKYGRCTALPVVIDPTTLSEAVVISSSKEIHVVQAEEGKNYPLLVAKGNKGLNKLSKESSPRKEKDKEKEKVQEGRSNYATKKMSHLASLPPRKKDKGMATSEQNIGKQSLKVGELEPLFGAVIVTITLFVMLIWGKTCAVLCTVIFLYVIPRLRVTMLEPEAFATVSDDDKNHGHRVDFDSWEYKKKIVLQGLLERNIQH